MRRLGSVHSVSWLVLGRFLARLKNGKCTMRELSWSRGTSSRAGYQTFYPSVNHVCMAQQRAHGDVGFALSRFS